jgi:hypothetical protein
VKSLKILAAVTALGAGLSLAACSSDDDGGDDKAPAETTAQAAALPTSAELSEILNRAVDPNLPADQKADTVQGGDQATELFDVMTQSKQESGADFQIVDPVLPGVLPDTVQVSMNLIIPEREPQPVNGVEFVKEGDQWKLSTAWACTLIQNVAPDKVPPLCANADNPPAPEQAPAPEGAPAPEDAPAPADAPAPEGAPAPEDAPAPEEAPADAPAPEEAPAPAA